MKKTIIIILTIIIATAVYLDLRDDQNNKKNIIKGNTLSTITQPKELTEDDYNDIALYVQDKEAMKKTDCKITKKIEYTIPKKLTSTDTVLKILFSDELKKYGSYKSVSVENGVAKVMMISDMTNEGKNIESLSSCESDHLMSVLKDTLVQYESIKSVKLFSPKGEIVF